MKDNINRAKIPDELDFALAADADLNNIWEKVGTRFKTPAQRITVGQALIAVCRIREPEDTLPQYQN